MQEVNAAESVRKYPFRISLQGEWIPTGIL